MTDYGVKMSREAPYKYLRHAAINKWLQFIPPNENDITRQFREKFFWLKQVEVVHTMVLSDVAYRAAVMVVDLLREYRRSYPDKRTVHIGFTGGFGMRTVAEKLAELFRQPRNDLPKNVVFHALVGGFDVENPVTDPNTFFSYFFDVPEIKSQIDVTFVSLHAPAIVVPGGPMGDLLKLPGIREAHRGIGSLDIILTSAGGIEDEHSMLYRYYNGDARKTLDMLKRDRCVGDMLWMPLGPEGPLDTAKYPFRAMTLIELNELPSKIREGTHVLLVCGPCARCREPKSEILRTILNLDAHLITHLVTDSRTAHNLL